MIYNVYYGMCNGVYGILNWQTWFRGVSMVNDTKMDHVGMGSMRPLSIAEWRAWISSNFQWLKVSKNGVFECIWRLWLLYIVILRYNCIYVSISLDTWYYMIFGDVVVPLVIRVIRVLPFSAWPPISRRFSKNRVACKEIFQLRTEDLITHLPATLTKNQAG
jgi:hypothetical protein